MKTRSLKLMIYILLFLATISTYAAESINDIKQDCREDLKYLPIFLKKNDAGVSSTHKKNGKTQHLKWLDLKTQQIAGIKNETDCAFLLNTYVSWWRPTHIGIESLVGDINHQNHNISDVKPPKNSLSPVIVAMSEKTIRITIPSFSPQFRLPLDRLLQDNLNLLNSHPNWIIDVRSNHGGADSTYTSLLPWLISHERVSTGVEFLVTDENIRSQINICDDYSGLDRKQCRESLAPLVNGMKTVDIGDYYRPSPSIFRFLSKPDLSQAKPEKIAILVDGQCASSCEQFLLESRQSFRVKIIGQPTLGALDYSNLRPHLLPSGKRRLMYATSRSLRLPTMSVDASGVTPDIYLPKYDGDKELLMIKQWLESGVFNAK